MKVDASELAGQELPSWYGIAWRIYHTDEIVLFPVPFNLIARAAHAVYWFAFRLLKFSKYPEGELAERRKIFDRGYAQGARDVERDFSIKHHAETIKAFDDGWRMAFVKMGKGSEAGR